MVDDGNSLLQMIIQLLGRIVSFHISNVCGFLDDEHYLGDKTVVLQLSVVPFWLLIHGFLMHCWWLGVVFQVQEDLTAHNLGSSFSSAVYLLCDWVSHVPLSLNFLIVQWWITPLVSLFHLSASNYYETQMRKWTEKSFSRCKHEMKRVLLKGTWRICSDGL